MQYEHESITEQSILNSIVTVKPPYYGCYSRLSPVWVTLLLGSAREAIEGPLCAGSRISDIENEGPLLGKLTYK